MDDLQCDQMPLYSEWQNECKPCRLAEAWMEGLGKYMMSIYQLVQWSRIALVQGLYVTAPCW